MNEQKKPHRPIGYWLKQADERLTERIDEVQRANGLTRLDWQALNVIQETGTASHDEIAETLRPFADTSTVKDSLARLVTQDSVSESDTEYELTDDGAALYERALSSQKEIRQRAVAGISETEYATTVSVLQRLVENLEQDSAA